MWNRRRRRNDGARRHVLTSVQTHLPDLGPKSPWDSFWAIQLGGWIAYFVAIYVTFLTIAPPGNALSLLGFKAFRALTGLVLTSFVLRPIYRRFRQHLSIGGLILVVLLCATVLGSVWTAIEFAYVSQAGFAPSVPGYLARSPRIALDYAMTVAAWSALYLGVTFWREWQVEREHALVSDSLTQAAQLEMLRYQINPHFLFNALNSIRASVDEDAARAKRMVTQLAEFLRYSLLREHDTTICLSEELEAVKNYLEIEKIRFEEKLEVAFDIEAAANSCRVPSFLLNPLVENAVTHGLRTSAKPLRISLSAKVRAGTLVLDVMNSGTLGPHSLHDTNGIGLSNVRRRLEKLFGSMGRMELTQEQDWVRARIEVPDGISSHHR
jgi:two-component system LytT family sensor kinase